MKLNYRELHQFYRNWYYVAKKCEVDESNYVFVAHSHLIIGMIKSLLILLETYIVRTKFVRIHFACIKRLFILLNEVIVSVLNASPRVRCA